MTIRNRLTYKFTFIVAVILLLFSVAIYYFSADYREAGFNLRLKHRALTTAKHLLHTKGINADLLRALDKNTVNALYHGNVIIYNSKNEIVYKRTDEETIQTPSAEILNKILTTKEVFYKDGIKQVIGVLFTEKSEQFVIIASAVDEYGLNWLSNLRLILIISLVSTISVTALAGFIFSGQALKPISAVVKEVENITINNLTRKLSEGNGTDEIAQLAIKFNKMLERLESAFEMQRSFVANASHELRTPLTAVGGQIEVALMTKREVGEYEIILQSIWEDIKNLNKLSNGLLDLAQASLDVSRIKLKNIRIDEILWQSRDELIKRQKNYSVNIEYKELPEDEKKLMVKGSEQLLKTAIVNIMDNACKYSSDNCSIVKIGFENEFVVLQFVDKGIGITENDIKYIFEPFYRTGNARGFQGHGIGLSLAKKIINLHNGSIHLSSILNSGTSVEISLPVNEKYYSA